jgi:hypothetical protein
MNERQVSEAVVDWIGDIAGIADDDNHRFTYPVANVLGSPPIVAGVVDRKRLAPAVDELATLLFPQLAMQQAVWVRVFECSASIMVEVEEDADAEAAEAIARTQFQALQAFGAALEADAWADDSLSARLGTGPTAAFISPSLVFDYTPVFRELEDGTRGRTMVVEVRVGEVVHGEPE